MTASLWTYLKHAAIEWHEDRKYDKMWDARKKEPITFDGVIERNFDSGLILGNARILCGPYLVGPTSIYDIIDMKTGEPINGWQDLGRLVGDDGVSTQVTRWWS